MARDRFVHLESDSDQESIQESIRIFLGRGVGTINIFSVTRFLVELPGTPSGHTIAYRKERFVEVWHHAKTISVITRQHDPFVNSIADGLARFLASRLHGRLENETHRQKSPPSRTKQRPEGATPDCINQESNERDSRPGIER